MGKYWDHRECRWVTYEPPTADEREAEPEAGGDPAAPPRRPAGTSRG